MQWLGGRSSTDSSRNEHLGQGFSADIDLFRLDWTKCTSNCSMPWVKSCHKIPTYPRQSSLHWWHRQKDMTQNTKMVISYSTNSMSRIIVR
jgi:hypothetical protein